MRCSVLCVGTELLLGQIYDTNSTYISERLSELGISSFEKRTVGDNAERIASAVVDMLHEADVLIVTGGLGPTHDDITREVLADLMGVDLELDESVASDIEAIFAKRNREMNKNNLRQAMVPIGASVLCNPLGTAPGLQCQLKVGGNAKTVFLTPGVPHEMEHILEASVLPILLSKKQDSNVIITRTLKTWGLGESALAEKLEDLVIQAETGDVKLGFLARGMNGIYIKLSVSSPSIEMAKELIVPIEEKVKEKVGEYVYAYDQETMESKIIDLLKETKSTLSVCESLTGGMVMSRLVEYPGASEVIAGGMVTYQTQVKRKFLNVQAQDIYSHECAQQMAENLRKELKTTFALSATGVAGPDPDGGHVPGEVYVGVSSEEDLFSEGFLLGGDRQRVREYCTITALDVLRKHLLRGLKRPT